ncbi:MAG: VOC family protein [Promethearchaeota archaeon]
MKLTKFDQIGIIVKDIEKAVKIYENIFDFSSSLNIVTQKSRVIYKGKEIEFTMKKIMQNFGGKQFEIIELIDSTGDHLYSDFLKEGNEGLHHLGIYMKGAEDFISQVKEKEKIEVIQQGSAGKVNFYFLDTRKILGYYIEIISF